jgi:hypothetical protein
MALGDSCECQQAAGGSLVWCSCASRYAPHQLSGVCVLCAPHRSLTWQPARVEAAKAWVGLLLTSSPYNPQRTLSALRGLPQICDDFIIDDWLRAKLKASEEELIKERECVGHLIGVEGAACRIGPGEDTMLPGEN